MKRYLGLTVENVIIQYDEDGASRDITGVEILFDSGEAFNFSLYCTESMVVGADWLGIDAKFRGNKVEYISAYTSNSGEIRGEAYECSFEMRVEGDSWLQFNTSLQLQCGETPRGFKVEHFDEEFVEDFDIGE